MAEKIRARELRIGNITHYRVHDNVDERKEYDVENTVDAEDILFISENPNHGYSGIAITEEWAKRLGCVKGDRRGFEAWELPVNKVSLAVSFLHDCVRLWAHGLYWDYNQMYVHSIQNICLDLTGKELKLTQPHT